MKVVVSAEAAAQIEWQVRYLHKVGATAAAISLQRRVLDFLMNHLTSFPRTGTYLAHKNLWEFWIPGTRLVVWYAVHDETVSVVTVWHTSQNRFDPTDER